MGSNRVYIIDTGNDPKAPSIYKVIEPEEINNLDCTALHTTHCLPTGEIMISSMGDKNGNAKGDFVLIDGKTYKPIGTWVKGNKVPKFGYDFWYQPYYDIMVSSEWGTPNVFKKGFTPADAVSKDYGRSLNIFSWSKRELIQSIDLGAEGIAPLEVRFLHNPLQKQGFVGCAVNATVFRFYLDGDGKIKTEKVIKIPPKKVTGWVDDYIQGMMKVNFSIIVVDICFFLIGMVTDIILSLDDKYLYLSNWLHGDVRQYDITDPQNPKLTGQVFLGGMIVNDSKVKVIEDQELSAPPEPVYVKNRRLYGAPQMLQLSLDGKRLYATSSLFTPWDKQFYPDTLEQGATMVKLDVDVENGGLSLDEEFLVDFGKAPGGPLLAHEMRLEKRKIILNKIVTVFFADILVVIALQIFGWPTKFYENVK